MKMRRDTVTGIVGLVGCVWFFIMTQSVRQPAKLLEPGPRVLIAMSSIALIIKGVRERETEEKPYFPKGGAKKIARSYGMLVLYAAALTYLGFLISTPFATRAFIYDLKGNSQVKLVPAILISLGVTAVLYGMFVYGFQVKLPAGMLFE